MVSNDNSNVFKITGNSDYSIILDVLLLTLGQYSTVHYRE